MKLRMLSHFLITLTLLTPTLSLADKIQSAEQLARAHSESQIIQVSKRLNVQFYDGPYDGELPLFECTLVNRPGCHLYETMVPNINVFDLVSDSTTQEVEDYLYYSAYRNVNAGYYSARFKDAYSELVDRIGIKSLIAAEIYLLKTGQKPISLFSAFSEKKDLVSTAKEIYR